MTNSINYVNAPEEIEQTLESVTVVRDLLPSPSELVRKTEKEKITIAIDKRSLELSKQYTRKHNARYQTMINGVLGPYADKFLSHR